MCIWCFLLHHQETLSCTTLKLKKKKKNRNGPLECYRQVFAPPFQMPSMCSSPDGWIQRISKNFISAVTQQTSIRTGFSRSFPRKIKKKPTAKLSQNYRTTSSFFEKKKIGAARFWWGASLFSPRRHLWSVARATQPRPARRHISKGNFDQSLRHTM